ncbi:hypothetical protein [Aeromicrobium sp. P5_D10]
MRRRRVIGSAVATVLVLASALVAANSSDWNGGEPKASSSTAATEANGTSDPIDSSASEDEVSDNGVTNGDGSEVIRQPEGSKTKGLPGLSKVKPSTKTSLISKRLPPSASSRGSIVAGFPVSVIPVAPDSVVRSSGVSSTAKTLQVSIVANSSKSRGTVLRFYRHTLSARGFAESSAPTTAGSTAASFKRGADHLIVTARAGAKNTSYSLFGTLQADAQD